jgi:hypothetical protein
MKKIQYFSFLLAIFFLSASKCNKVEPVYEDPYTGYNYWYKGSTHIHTTASDGDLSFEAVIDKYKVAGYDFIAITDHNKVGNKTSNEILVIQGCESGDSWENHLIALNVNNCPFECCSNDWCYYTTGRPRCSKENNQKRINNATSQGGIAILAHPSDTHGQVEMGWSDEKMLFCKNYTGIEIFSSDNNSIEKWDLILRNNKKAWGFASALLHESPRIG